VFKLHNKSIAEHLPMPVWDDNTDGANDDDNNVQVDCHFEFQICIKRLRICEGNLIYIYLGQSACVVCNWQI
jgi:hypothetical protein